LKISQHPVKKPTKTPTTEQITNNKHVQTHNFPTQLPKKNIRGIVGEIFSFDEDGNMSENMTQIGKRDMVCGKYNIIMSLGRWNKSEAAIL
jgi:hypothetical protein